MSHLATPAPIDVSRNRANELIGWLREYAADRINSKLIDERQLHPAIHHSGLR